MPRGILISIDAWNRRTGTRVTVRVGASRNSTTLGAGGVAWEPLIRRAPRLAMQLCDDDLTGTLMLGTGELAIKASDLKFPHLPAGSVAPADLDWAGSPIVIFSGDGAQLGRYRTEFSGRVTGGLPSPDNGIASLSIEVDKSLVDVPLLTLTYGGGGGADGDVELRGNIKPAGYGSPINVRPVLVKAVSNIYQVDAYGNMTGLNGVYEDLASFGASLGDYASFAALDAANIPEGRFATCFAEGLFRLGAAATGTITCDPVCGANLPGSMMLRWLRTHAGVPDSKIRISDFDNLTAAVQTVVGATPRVSFWSQDENNVLDLMQRMAASCNASLLLMLDGRIGVSRAFGGVDQLALDRQGGTPTVTAWQAGDPPVPWWRLKMPTAKAYYVNSPAEIDYEDDIRDMGNYSAAETYRQGMVVRGGDGARYLFTNATPTSGVAPPNAAYWELYEDAPDATTIKYPSGYSLAQKEPADAGATAGANWTSNVTFRPANLAELGGGEGVKNGLVSVGANGVLSGGGGGQVTFSGIGGGPVGLLSTVDLAGGYASGLLPTTRAVGGLINVNIAMGANGVLIGAGGGQVTIRGIGYLGDLSATRGFNLISNGDAEFGTADGWFILEQVPGTTSTTFKAVADAPASGVYSFQLLKSPTAGGAGYATAAVPVTGGEALVLSCDALGATSSTKGFFFRAHFSASFPAGGGAVPGTATSQSNIEVPVVADVGLSLGYTHFEKTINVPAGMRWMSLAIYSWVDGANDTRIDNVTASRAYNWATGLTNRPSNLAALSGTEGINNGLVAIGTNGVLSGAGGGQVTITGLGFGGDLDAQRNSRITISGGVLSGIGTSGRYIDNSAITISSGYLSAGYGNVGTPITNSLVSIAANGSLSGGGGGQVTFSGIGGGPVGTLTTIDLSGAYASGVLPTSRAAGGLINSNVSIGANGTLSGAGGGQVTVRGLGYTGDLAATGGINLIPNGNAELGTIDGWGALDTAGAGGTFGAIPDAAASGLWSFRFGKAATSDGLGYGTAAVPVAPGETIVLSCDYLGSAASSNGFFFRAQFAQSYPAGGVVQSSGNGISLVSVIVDGPVAGGYQHAEKAIVVPAGAKWMTVAVYNFSGGPTDIRIDNVTAYRASNWNTGLTARPSNLAALGGGEGINNALVTIGGNGVLAGGGGGQVTITGLGYGGDLDAQRNTRISIVSGGGISGIGSGDGTIVSNLAISITGTSLNGIGPGNGTAVSNVGITISAGGALSGGGGGQVTIRGIGYAGDLTATTSYNLVSNGDAEQGDVIGWQQVDIAGAGAFFNNVSDPGISGSRHFQIAKVGDTNSGAGFQTRAFAVSPGQRIAIGCDRLAASSQSAGGFFLRGLFSTSIKADGFIDRGGSATQLQDPVADGPWFFGQTHAEGIVTVPPGCKWMSVAIYSWVTAPMDVRVDNVFAMPAALSNLNAVTGRARDTRLLNSSNAYGLRSLSQPPGFSASVANGATTITLDGAGVYYTDWSATISLPSASFPGLAFTTMYYFWRNMPVDGVGDSYGYSTDLTQALGTGKSYFGNYTTPSSGGGGGGGGYYGGENCVSADAWVPTSNRGVIQARDVRAGDMLFVLSADLDAVTTAPCTANRVGRNDCCRLIGAEGAKLTLAINTPITLRGNAWIVAANAWGREVAHLFSTNDEMPAWLRLPNVEGIGEMEVARISCGDGTYAAADDMNGPYLFTHNLRPQKP